MRLLPNWALTVNRPMRYDAESATPLQQTARVYAAMNELIEEYNKFSEEASKRISEFENKEGGARKEFEERITKIMREFTCSIKQYVENNLEQTSKDILNDALQAGTITIEEVYDEEKESLSFVIGGSV